MIQKNIIPEQYNFITVDNLKSLNLPAQVKKSIATVIKTQGQTLQGLYQIVDILLKQIKLVMLQTSNKGSYTYSYKHIRQNTFRDIMVTGAMLIFKLRQFLLNEEIVFSLGATNEHKQLFERQVHQDELFNTPKAIRGSLSQQAVVLNGMLEHFNTEFFTQVGEAEIWPQIEELAFGRYTKDDKKEVNEVDYYQKSNRDQNVYVRFRGKSKSPYYYYNKNNYMQFYNRGWLYEWYMEFLQDENNIKTLKQHLQKGSFEPIIKKMDAVPGYKGGDYKSSSGIQMQAKMQNKQIISFVSINKVLNEIKTSLGLLLSSQNNMDEAAAKFINLFTEDSNSINSLNTSLRKTVQSRLHIKL